MRDAKVISFNSPDREKTFADAVAKVKEMYPDYEIQAAFDTDFSAATKVF